MKIKDHILGFLSKLFFSLLMIWLSVSVGFVMGGALARIHWMDTTIIVFSACFILYFMVHILIYKPILSHVMAHELTHAMAAVLMGGKVTSIHASTTGGTTVVNKSHLFISLAPYIFPLYTAVTLVLYAIAAQPFKIYLIGLIGFTYAFHLALTVYSLSHQQPDLKEGGVVFSLIFIFTGNMIVLMLLFTILWPQTLPLTQAFSETLHWALSFAKVSFHFLKSHLIHSEGSAT